MTTESNVIEETSVAEGETEPKAKKQMNFFSPVLKEHLEARGFKYSSFHSTSGFVYTLGRTATAPEGTSDEALAAAAVRMGDNLIIAANGVEKEGVQVNFKVLDTKVEKLDGGKVNLYARIKTVNYDGGRKPRKVAAKAVPFIPEFDLDGNVINAPVETIGEVSNEAVNENVTAKRKVIA